MSNSIDILLENIRELAQVAPWTEKRMFHKVEEYKQMVLQNLQPDLLMRVHAKQKTAMPAEETRFSLERVGGTFWVPVLKEYPGENPFEILPSPVIAYIVSQCCTKDSAMIKKARFQEYNQEWVYIMTANRENEHRITGTFSVEETTNNRGVEIIKPVPPKKKISDLMELFSAMMNEEGLYNHIMSHFQFQLKPLLESGAIGTLAQEDVTQG